MKKRYRLIRRGTRGGTYYCVDTQTGSRTSLGKISSDEAEQIVQHKNTAIRHRGRPRLRGHRDVVDDELIKRLLDD